MPRSVSLILFALAALVALGAVLLTLDWWIALPEGLTADYVGRDVCIECHQEEYDLWAGSDHDLAMDHAAAETVLGDFDDQEFHHVAFDEFTKLGDDDLRLVLEQVEIPRLALALHGAAEPLVEKFVNLLSEEQTAQLARDREWLVAVRPCDVTDARQEIADIVRRLETEGLMTADFGLRSKLFRLDEKFFVTTDNREGEMETFQVKYVFGVRPLQQYLVEFPDGRIQCLPITWDTEKKQWYHLYPSEPIPHDDQLHWTRQLQNWNYMCAECHTTNLQRNYDLATDTYNTTWSEIDVSCETCHGPGSIHVELSESKSIFWDRRYRYGLPNLKDENPRVEIETCAPCHSRRRIVYPDYHPGGKFLDHYMPEIIDGELYYADGQILDEDYVYGSFMQSRMYHEQVRCSNCHDPHSIRVKFTDNGLCTQCHVAATYDTTKHHHHPDASQPGTMCVECHMPQTTYMVADPRRDHSLRVPRPDLTVTLDIPNACNGCHNDRSKDETPQWAEEKCLEWYGEPDLSPHFAHAIAGGRREDPDAQTDLAALARRNDTRPPIRASAISLLSRYNTDRARAAAYDGLEDDEELVRTTAVRSLQYLELDELLRRLSPMLHDPVRSVRLETARVLARVPRGSFSPKDGEAFDRALAEYLKSQQALDDQAAAHLNMAIVHADVGHTDLAVNEYRTALRIDPDFLPARINLAMLANRIGDNAEAEKHLRRVIQQEPEAAEIHYSLGLLLAEDEERLEEACEFLGTAASLGSDNPRVAYNYGLALQRLNRYEEAETALRNALRLSEGRRDYVEVLNALRILYIQQEQWDKAIACTRELARRQPENPQWAEQLKALEQQRNGPPEG